MSWFPWIKKQKAGEVIMARTIRQTTESAEWASHIRASAPIAMSNTGAGPLIRMAGSLYGAYIGNTESPGISAMSGTTPGSGPVTIQSWNGSSLNYIAQSPMSMTEINFTAYSILSTPIPADVYVTILKIYGVYWIIDVGPVGVAFTNPVSGCSGATGSWPSLTAESFTGDVYSLSGGEFTLVQSGATCWNGFPASLASGKVCTVIPDGAGDWNVVSQSCT